MTPEDIKNVLHSAEMGTMKEKLLGASHLQGYISRSVFRSDPRMHFCCCLQVFGLCIL